MFAGPKYGRYYPHVSRTKYIVWLVSQSVDKSWIFDVLDGCSWPYWNSELDKYVFFLVQTHTHTHKQAALCVSFSRVYLREYELSHLPRYVCIDYAVCFFNEWVLCIWTYDVAFFLSLSLLQQHKVIVTHYVPMHVKAIDLAISKANVNLGAFFAHFGFFSRRLLLTRLFLYSSIPQTPWLCHSIERLL